MHPSFLGVGVVASEAGSSAATNIFGSMFSPLFEERSIDDAMISHSSVVRGAVFRLIMVMVMFRGVGRCVRAVRVFVCCWILDFGFLDFGLAYHSLDIVILVFVVTCYIVTIADWG